MRYTDLHCDTLMKAFFEGRKSLYEIEDGMFRPAAFRRADGLLQFFAVYFPPHNERYPGLPEDLVYFKENRQIFLRTMEDPSGEFQKVTSVVDYRNLLASGRMGGLLAIEDGKAVEGRMEQLDAFFEQDVRLISLTWNFENCFGFPNSKDQVVMERGLKPFGKEAVERMNEIGMLVDVSHLSDGGFRDVADISRVPFVASHSNCRALAPHPRNLTDEMIRRLAERGGVMGLNVAPSFVDPNPSNPVSNAALLAKHARHAADVGGVDIVAVGTDFDGTWGQIEIDTPERMELLWDSLKKEGFTEQEIEKIAWKNAERVLLEVLPEK